MITGKESNINTLSNLIQQAGPRIADAIKGASTKTGVDFSYLMQQAQAESSFRSDVKAKTSSATGLFQFIEKTWIGMIKEHGDKYGLGEFASHIDDNGKIADPNKKQEILDLRKDPEIASVMAAELAAVNKKSLAHRTSFDKDDIGSTELYFAHFMGAGGASNFFNALEENPMAKGADLFPREARANQNVFYDAESGRSKTLAEIYDFFDKKFQINNSGSGDIYARSTESSNQTSYSSYSQKDFLDISDQVSSTNNTDQPHITRNNHSAEQLMALTNLNGGSSNLSYMIDRSLNRSFGNSPESSALPSNFGVNLLNSLSVNPVETMLLSLLEHKNNTDFSEKRSNR